MSNFFKLVAVVGVVALAGCGGKPAADAAPAGASPQQIAVDAEIAKQRNEIAEERASLEKERQAFRAEQQAANETSLARVEQIRKATAEYAAAELRHKEHMMAIEKEAAESQAAQRYREDVLRLSSMNSIDKIRVRTAVGKFRAGKASQEEAEILLQFNEFRDTVINEIANGDMHRGILTKPPSFRVK